MSPRPPGWIGPALVAVAVVLAGCSAPTASPETTERGPAGETREDLDGIRVEGGELPADPNRTFRRVQALLGSDVERPERVQVRAIKERSAPAEPDLPPFYRLLGVDYAGGGGVEDGPDVGGTTSFRGGVVVYAGDDETTVRYVLVHEFVHVVQFRNERLRQVVANVPAGTTDGAFVVRSVIEGVAVYVTDAYIDRYIDTEDTNAALYARQRDRLRPGGIGQYGNSMYLFGDRYVEGRVDGPGDTARVYEDPPTTSEQVIHGYAPGEEPPRALNVTVAEEGAWSAAGTDRLGEGWIRVALRNGLNGSAADRAAAGWGNDSLQVFRNGNRSGYVWVLRFDDAANASEFHRLFGRYLDARGNRSDGAWVVDGETFDRRQVAADTVAVAIGPRSLTANVSLRGSGGNVTVDVGTTADDGGSRSGNATGDGRQSSPASGTSSPWLTSMPPSSVRIG